MVWIAESPKYDADDRRLFKYLEIRMGIFDAKRVVKMFNLYKYLKTKRFKSPDDVETCAYYDSKKTKPIFTRKTAKSIFTLMTKQSGGAGDEAIVLDRAIRGMVGYIQEYLPSPITIVAGNVYSLITFLKRLEEAPGFGPFVDIGKEAVVQATKTLIVGANDLATDVGGPAGAVAVALPAAIATTFVVVTHLLEDELGEALLVSFLAVPFVGPTLYKAAGSLGKIGRKVFEHKNTIVGTTRTFLGDSVGDKVEYLIPRMDAREQPEEVPAPAPTPIPAGITTGAKRFSTRRQKKHKWIRTKSARR